MTQKVKLLDHTTKSKIIKLYAADDDDVIGSDAVRI